VLSADQFKYLVFGVAALVIVGGSAALAPSQRRKILKRLAGRNSLTDDEFRSLFAAADAEIALTIRNQLTRYLVIPVELVHPDDKLKRIQGQSSAEYYAPIVHVANGAVRTLTSTTPTASMAESKPQIGYFSRGPYSELISKGTKH